MALKKFEYMKEMSYYFESHLICPSIHEQFQNLIFYVERNLVQSYENTAFLCACDFEGISLKYFFIRIFNFLLFFCILNQYG